MSLINILKLKHILRFSSLLIFILLIVTISTGLLQLSQLGNSNFPVASIAKNIPLQSQKEVDTGLININNTHDVIYKHNSVEQHYDFDDINLDTRTNNEETKDFENKVQNIELERGEDVDERHREEVLKTSTEKQTDLNSLSNNVITEPRFIGEIKMAVDAAADIVEKKLENKPEETITNHQDKPDDMNLVSLVEKQALETLKQSRVNETEKEFMMRMERRMEERRSLMKQNCRKIGINLEKKEYFPWDLNLPNPAPWTFVSNDYGLMYCEIPKSGCSNWKKVLMVLNGLVNTTENLKQGAVHASPIGMVDYHPNKTLKEIYKNSTKLIVVREPFERLVSAFVDKLALKKFHETSVFPKFSVEVAKKYGKRWKDPTIHLSNGMREITVCDFQEAALTCSEPHQVIHILTAAYGRFDDKTCLKKDENFLSVADWSKCIATESHYITSQLCNGKKKCDVVASQYQFGRLRNCRNIPKYLTIKYHCISTEHLQTVIICEREKQSIQCPLGGVISIRSAFFGRTNRVTCSFAASLHNLDCVEETATAAVASACDGRQSCIVEATPRWIQSDTCPATTKYLQVWFSCHLDRPPVVKMNSVDEKPKDKNSIMVPKAKGSRNILSMSMDEGKVQTPNSSAKVSTNHHEVVQPDATEIKLKPPEIYKKPNYLFKNYDVQANVDEFASYIVDPSNADVTRDVIDHGSPGMKSTSVRHWQTYHTLCYPCHIQYDVIAHMETIEEDSRYLLKRIGAPPTLSYPHGYDTSGKSSTNNDAIESFFSQLTEDKIKKLYQVYKIDYELFGYSLPKQLRTNET